MAIQRSSGQEERKGRNRRREEGGTGGEKEGREESRRGGGKREHSTCPCMQQDAFQSCRDKSEQGSRAYPVGHGSRRTCICERKSMVSRRRGQECRKADLGSCCGESVWAQEEERQRRLRPWDLSLPYSFLASRSQRWRDTLLSPCC
eukprot:754954-Hanusia_phi.AAC.1